MAFGESVHALRLLERLGLKHYLDGDVLDLGCGPEAVSPRATGVNRHGVFPVKDLDCDPLSTDLAEHFKTRQFDAVFSSHALEHMYSPIGVTLDFWLRFVKPGGYMVLYLPDEKYYRFHANPMIRNPEHLHYLTMDTFEWRAGQLNGATLEHLIPDVDTRHGRYSFLAIVRKT